MRFHTLQELVRIANGRQFTAQNRHGRRARILGFGPTAAIAIGWYEGSEKIEMFDTSTRDWERPAYA